MNEWMNEWMNERMYEWMIMVIVIDEKGDDDWWLMMNIDTIVKVDGDWWLILMEMLKLMMIDDCYWWKC